jgi:hypothetical protein
MSPIVTPKVTAAVAAEPPWKEMVSLLSTWISWPEGSWPNSNIIMGASR